MNKNFLWNKNLLTTHTHGTMQKPKRFYSDFFFLLLFLLKMIKFAVQFENAERFCFEIIECSIAFLTPQTHQIPHFSLLKRSPLGQLYSTLWCVCSRPKQIAQWIQSQTRRSANLAVFHIFIRFCVVLFGVLLLFLPTFMLNRFAMYGLHAYSADYSIPNTYTHTHTGPAHENPHKVEWERRVNFAFYIQQKVCCKPMRNTNGLDDKHVST